VESVMDGGRSRGRRARTREARRNSWFYRQSRPPFCGPHKRYRQHRWHRYALRVSASRGG